MQSHAQLPCFVVVYFKGAEEIQVLDRERPGFTVAAQCLGRQFEVAGAGQQGLASFRAVAIQNPAVFAAVGGVEDPVPLRIKGGFVQQRLAGRVARGRWLFTQAFGHGRSRHADFIPDAPVDRDHAGASAGPVAGVGVEVFVGGHVVDLTGRRGDRAGGRAQHQPVDAAVREQAVQNLHPVHLGRKHLFNPARGFGEERSVVNHTGAVDHRMDAAEALRGLFDRQLHVTHIAHIGCEHQHLGTQTLEAPHVQNTPHQPVGRVARAQYLVPRLGRGHRAARQQNQARLFLAGQALGQRQADAAQATRDQADAPLGPCTHVVGWQKRQRNVAQFKSLGTA